jgi:hypothetical protein
MRTAGRAAGGVEIGEGEHVIGAFHGSHNGPTLIAIGSLHGNEPGGAAALVSVERALHAIAGKLRGRVYLLAGNTRALRQGVRFIDADLNRQWTKKNMSIVGSERMCRTAEGTELTELDQIIDSILITARDEVYVLDLHSTSAGGRPFATVGDTMRNRRFAQKFPITILLGIEEQLEGTMLEYINLAGAVTLGFEGGQHLSQLTVSNHEALVWLALANTGVLGREDIPVYERSLRQLGEGRNQSRVYEVRYRHAVAPQDVFEMRPGYNNFDPVARGDQLGTDFRGPVTAAETGVILMPLYQKLGEDGFFIGRRISPFWLKVSEILRTLGVQDLVRYLPGVTHDPVEPATLIVNTRVARLFPLQIFHLLGFRKRRWMNKHLVVSRRKHDTESPFRPKKG